MRPILSAAQRKTERKLKALESARYLSLRQRAIPGSDAIIDHVVVGPTGVYAIGSERWDRRLPVRAPGLKQLLHGPFSRKDLLDVARWKAAQATELIQAALGRPVVVRPALVIYGPRLPWTVAKVRNVDVFAGKHLRKYLRGSIKAGRGYRLSIADIEDIYEATVRVLPQWLPATPPVRTRGTDVLEARTGRSRLSRRGSD